MCKFISGPVQCSDSPAARRVIIPRVLARVAQLDRASVYGTEGYRFESCRACYPKSLLVRDFFLGRQPLLPGKCRFWALRVTGASVGLDSGNSPSV